MDQTTTLTEAQQAEVAALKKMALDLYEQDGGVMAECWGNKDYIEAILKDGTAAAAWAWQVRIIDAKRESQACYDAGEW